MAIKYSLTEKKTFLGQSDVEGKLYPTAQNDGILNTKEFTKRLCKRYRTLDPIQVQSVLEAVTSFLRTELLEGYRVQLEPLGTFSVAIVGRGAESRVNYARTHIEDVKVNWRPAKELRDLMKDAKFQLVEPRKTQKQAKELSKAKKPKGEE